MPDLQPDDGLAEMEGERQQRRRKRQVPPSRHPQPTPADTAAGADTPPAAPATETGTADTPTGPATQPPPAQPEQPAGPAPEPPATVPVGETDRRTRNIALKRFEDAAATWAAQVAKVNSRAVALKAMADAAKQAGVPLDRITDAVGEAAERHDVDPATLPRDVARAVGLTRRKR